VAALTFMMPMARSTKQMTTFKNIIILPPEQAAFLFPTRFSLNMILSLSGQ
jgi:hypothetical protein